MEKKLLWKLLNKKAACKMLVKLTPGGQLNSLSRWLLADVLLEEVETFSPGIKDEDTIDVAAAAVVVVVVDDVDKDGKEAFVACK